MTTINFEKLEIDTKGTCLLCLETKAQITNCKLGSLASSKGLKHFLRYLEVNPKELFNFSTEFLQSMDIREDIDLKISLCSGCSSVTERFNKLYQEYELIQLQFGDCVQSLHQSISKGNGNSELVRKYNDQMRPTKTSDLVNASMAANLRSETLKKCILKMQSGIPRVALLQKSKYNVASPLEASTSHEGADNNQTIPVVKPKTGFRRGIRPLQNANKPKFGPRKLNRKTVLRKSTIGTRSLSNGGGNFNMLSITSDEPSTPERRETRSLQNCKDPKLDTPVARTSRASSVSKVRKRVASTVDTEIPNKPTPVARTSRASSVSKVGKRAASTVDTEIPNKPTPVARTSRASSVSKIGKRAASTVDTEIPNKPASEGGKVTGQGKRAKLDDSRNNDVTFVRTKPKLGRPRKTLATRKPLAKGINKPKPNTRSEVETASIRQTRSFKKIRKPYTMVSDAPKSFKMKRSKHSRPMMHMHSMKYKKRPPPPTSPPPVDEGHGSSKEKVPKRKAGLIIPSRSPQNIKKLKTSATTTPVKVPPKVKILQKPLWNPSNSNRTIMKKVKMSTVKLSKLSPADRRRHHFGVACKHCKVKIMPGPSVKAHQILKHPEHIIWKLLPAHSNVSLEACKEAVVTVWNHMFEKCSSKNGYKCEFCVNQYTSKGMFKRHLIGIHEDQFAVKVYRKLESLPLDEADVLNNPLKLDATDEKVDAPSVETNVDVPTGSVKIKLQPPARKKSYVCQYCDYVTRFASALRFHSLERHPTDNVMAFLHTAVSRVECDTMVNLVLSQIDETGDACFKCGTQLANRALRRHLVVHHFDDILDEVKHGLETSENERNAIQAHESGEYEHKQMACSVDMDFGEEEFVKVDIEKLRAEFIQPDPLEVDELD